MQSLIRIPMIAAVLAGPTAAYAHGNPADHVHGGAAWLPHDHGAIESFAVMMLLAGIGALVLVALKQVREARLRRARQAIPVVIIRPGLRLFRDR